MAHWPCPRLELWEQRCNGPSPARTASATISSPTRRQALNLYASGTAPAISFSTISSSTETDNTEWRLVKPYQPVSIPAAVAPGGLSTMAGDGTVALGWTPSASDLYYNVYRSTVSGGPYSQVAGLLAGATFTDNTVTDGVSYYYVVTGLNILGAGILLLGGDQRGSQSR